MEEKTLVSGFLHQRNRVLLLKRNSQRTMFPEHFERPGGHVDETDRTLEAALKREFLEETGLYVTVLKRYHQYTNILEDIKYTEYSYLVDLIYPDQQVRISKEHEYHKWASLQDLSYYKIDKNEKEAIVTGFRQFFDK